MAKPTDLITVRGVREMWDVDPQVTRNRMSAMTFRAACPEYQLDDGTRVWSKRDIMAYTEARQAEWTA